MSEKKNILFITHHNNDFDHFLPLLVKLNNSNKMGVKIISFFTKSDVLKNKLHRYICKKNKIDIDEMNHFSLFSNINKLYYKLYNHINIKCGTNNKSSNNSEKIIKILNKVLVKYFIIISIFFISKKKINQYIIKNNIHLAIIDFRVFDENIIEKRPLSILKHMIKTKTSCTNYMIFKFCSFLRKKKIPILMMRHGVLVILLEREAEIYKTLEKPFQPDYIIENAEYSFIWQKHFHKYTKALKNTFILGDPRFDLNWMQYLQTCALEVYGKKIEKPDNKIVLLYLVDRFPFLKDGMEKYRLTVHKDILSLVNFFPNLEIWVKHHPRNVHKININTFIEKDKQKSIKQYGNDVDTNVLIAKSDICVSSGSGVFISPVLQKKPVIFYKKWKEKIKNIPCIFDDLETSASNRKELINQLDKIISNGYQINNLFLEKFYKEVFSAKSSDDDMSEKHINKFKDIIFP